jgi:HEAT repeat protein
MSEPELSPRELLRAQSRFTLFTALNVVSFQLLSGNIITLFALRLNASNFLVGLLYSFLPLAQILPLLGRLLATRIGAVRTIAIFWFARYILVAPILLAPAFAGERPEVGIALIIASVIGFNLARGIGITGHNPVIAGITTARDRGSFLARNQLVLHTVSILIGVTIAVVLGAVASIAIYSVLIATGIAAGIAASTVVSRMPEPPPEISRGRSGMVEGLRRVIARGGFRRFLVVLVLKSVLISMAVPFLVVYMKRGHGYGDSTVMILSVLGSLGAIGMALISGLSIDTTGPKPVSQVFGLVLLLGLLAVVITPGAVAPVLLWVLAALAFCRATMGANGLENGLSNYFFRLIPPEEVLNLGTVNFTVSGAAATAGSLAGGVILDSLERTSLSTMDAFRVYYGGLVVLILALLAVVTSLSRLGPAYTAMNVLGMFVSPRDLHAMGLLRRLRRGATRHQDTDQTMIRALGETRSTLSTSQLIAELGSPRFSLRSEALNALSSGTATEEVVTELMNQVRTQEFTTAYRAAEILGRSGALNAIPTLREAMHSSDYFLSGKSMVALAKLGDAESVSPIEELVAASGNPRVIIHAATALEILGSQSSVPVLVSVLRKRLSGFVRDEVNLALSGLLGLEEMYYPLYLAFIENHKLGVTSLKDYIAERLSGRESQAEKLDKLSRVAETVLGDVLVFTETVTGLLKPAHADAGPGRIAATLAEGASDPELVRLARFRFLLACFAIHSDLAGSDP